MEQTPVTEVSDLDREIAIELLSNLAARLGDVANRQVHADDLHRVICLMSAIVLESDGVLKSDDQFPQLSHALASVIELFAKKLRAERRQTGTGLMEIILTLLDAPHKPH